METNNPKLQELISYVETHTKAKIYRVFGSNGVWLKGSIRSSELRKIEERFDYKLCAIDTDYENGGYIQLDYEGI